jgi:OmpA-OmpF porin, OOP family
MTKSRARTRLLPLLTALGAGLAGLAPVAHAEGLYIGGSVGGAHYKGNSVGGLDTDRSSTGTKLFGGYQLTPNFAVEGGYVDLGKFNSAAGQLEGSGVYLDAVGSVPISGPWSAYGKLGVFNGRAENSLVGSDRGTSAKLGAGLQYTIDRNLSVQGEWERYRFDTSGARANTDLYSVGVKYSF